MRSMFLLVLDSPGNVIHVFLAESLGNMRNHKTISFRRIFGDDIRAIQYPVIAVQVRILDPGLSIFLDDTRICRLDLAGRVEVLANYNQSTIFSQHLFFLFLSWPIRPGLYNFQRLPNPVI